MCRCVALAVPHGHIHSLLLFDLLLVLRLLLSYTLVLILLISKTMTKFFASIQSHPLIGSMTHTLIGQIQPQLGQSPMMSLRFEKDDAIQK